MVLNITNQTDEADSWIVLRGRDDDDMFLAAAALVNAQSATARLPDEDVDCRSPHLEHFQMFSWGERRPDAEARIQQLFYEHGETFPVTASEYGIEGRVLKVSGKRGLILPDGCDTPVTYMTDRMSPEVWFGDTHGLWKQSYAADPESRKVTFGERVCVTGIQDPATGWINGAVVSKIDLTSEAPSP